MNSTGEMRREAVKNRLRNDESELRRRMEANFEDTARGIDVSFPENKGGIHGQKAQEAHKD